MDRIAQSPHPFWCTWPWALALICTLTIGGCVNGEEPAQSSRLRFVFVTHGQASDPFWSVVQNGATAAAREVGVRVEYQAPDSFDLVTMAQLIDAAVASRPDGLVVSIPDAEALRPALESAVSAGIPIISINSGGDVARSLGMLLHVGQSEYEAGYAGGVRMAEAGVTRALCINQEVGNLALDSRCAGFAEALAEADGAAVLLATELADPTESQQRIQAALRADPTIDGLLSLGPTGALPALRALQDMDLVGSVRLATFDTSPEILQAIDEGAIAFALDQQQYMQGYLPVVLLALRIRNENALANEVIRTGPGFITRGNLARLRELARQGTR